MNAAALQAVLLRDFARQNSYLNCLLFILVAGSLGRHDNVEVVEEKEMRASSRAASLSWSPK